MEALRKVRVQRRDPNSGEVHTRELRKVPTDSFVTADRLLTIVGDAVWQWAKTQNEHGQQPRGILEKAWIKIDQIPANTSGCKKWTNSHKPGFPFRPVCYSKTTQTCTLRNTPNKISRLELHEGLRELLGLSFAWCHMDLLMRTMNERAAPTARDASTQSIARETFIGALWPRVSKLAFDYSLERQPQSGSQSPSRVNVSAFSLQQSLVLTPEDDNQDTSPQQQRGRRQIRQNSHVRYHRTGIGARDETESKEDDFEESKTSLILVDDL